MVIFVSFSFHSIFISLVVYELIELGGKVVAFLENPGVVGAVALLSVVLSLGGNPGSHFSVVDGISGNTPPSSSSSSSSSSLT